MSHSLEEKKADRRFLTYVFIWVVFGLVVLTSASAPAGYEKFGDTYHFVKLQIIKGIIPGLILFLIFAKLNYRILKKIAWPVYLVSVFFLALVFVPGVGLMLNNSRSWISVGFFNFQPAEFAKLALIVFWAYVLSDERRDFSDWRTGLLPAILLIAPVPILILLQPDFGTLFILLMIIFFMLYFAKIPRGQLFVLGVFAVAAFAALFFAAPYRVGRLTTFLHPELDPKGIGYHVNQAFLAIGSGGMWGLGLGHSRQKFQYLPEVSSDSIYAVLAEELGFFISALFVVLIALVGRRGLQIAGAAPDEFSQLLVVGIIVWIVWQSFLNIGAMVGVLPLTGVPLPFVSHGGSAMAMGLAAIGIVAGVSRGK